MESCLCQLKEKLNPQINVLTYPLVMDNLSFLSLIYEKTKSPYSHHYQGEFHVNHIVYFVLITDYQ